MPVKLNRISNQAVQENLEHTSRRLRTMLAEPAPTQNSAALERYFDAIGKDSIDVGLMMYQQEFPCDAIRSHLARGGKYLLSAIRHRGRPRPDEHRSPWEFEKVVNLVVCFHTQDVWTTAAEVQEWQYRHPAYPEDQRVADYLEMLKRFVNGTPLNAFTYQQLETYCASDIASREEFVFLLPKLRGLRALEAGDGSTWNRAIADLVEAHEIEAQRGEYRLLPDGFMCLPALMLVELGRERGLACLVKSPYLPLSVLEMPA